MIIPDDKCSFLIGEKARLSARELLTL